MFMTEQERKMKKLERYFNYFNNLNFDKFNRILNNKHMSDEDRTRFYQALFDITKIYVELNKTGGVAYLPENIEFVLKVMEDIDDAYGFYVEEA